MHEAALFLDNCFVTLTYDDDHLPHDGGLKLEHFQTFIKELRRYIAPQRVTYLACGEYGEGLGRPHYHACLFGYDFGDKRFYTRRRGHNCYTSEALAGLWTFGRHEIGGLTYQSAGYVARYCTKKVTGDQAQGWYQKVNFETGEIYDVSPEFLVMSTRPAIGKRWFQRFSADLFPCDWMLVNGQKVSIPRYYKKLYERSNDPEVLEVKKRRFARATSRKVMANSTPSRLAVREVVKKAAVSRLKRNEE